MFDFINKEEYFTWADQGIPLGGQHGLKGAQDAFILALLAGKSGLRLLEVGGGDSRVLRQLSSTNECWNIDRFDGRDGGPKNEVKIDDVRNVMGHLGDFSPELPDDYFDYVFSVSVLEHVPEQKLHDTFRDCRRVLKAGALTAHAIDVYLLDSGQMSHPYQGSVRHRLRLYREAAQEIGLELVEPTTLPDKPSFSSTYVSNPDSVMVTWNRVAPSLRALREVAQSVSLKAIWRKPVL